jgi:hypothetical protein
MKKNIILIALLLVVLLCVFEFSFLFMSAVKTSISLFNTEPKGSTIAANSVSNTMTIKSNPGTKMDATKKVYLCITGQLSRLELHNKIQHLLLPLHSLGYTLYIGLALSESSPQFSNKNNGAKMRLKPSIKHVIRELQSVKGVKKVKHFPPQFHDLKFNAKYDTILGNYTEVDKDKRVVQKNYLDNQPVLAANNARQFKTLQSCNKWPDIDKKTDFLVRVREDVLIFKMDMSRILSLLAAGAVVTSQCDAWRGINDKLAFVPSLRASDFFNIPYQEYLTFDNKNHHIQKLNAETMYKIAYLKNGFILRSTDALVATKAMTTLKTEKTSPPAADGNNCTVIGNPFVLSLSKLCPTESLDRLSYSAACWN